VLLPSTQEFPVGGEEPVANRAILNPFGLLDEGCVCCLQVWEGLGRPAETIQDAEASKAELGSFWGRLVFQEFNRLRRQLVRTLEISGNELHTRQG